MKKQLTKKIKLSIENLEKTIKHYKQFNKEYKKNITDNKAHNVECKKEIEKLKSLLK